MKRRDLFKQASALMLGTSAVPASALLASPVTPRAASGTKDLVVTFAGPLCFWPSSEYSKVVAPPVGPWPGQKAPHQPWIGTTANEITIPTAPGTSPEFTLSIDGFSQPPEWPTATGTPGFTYEDGSGSGIAPLFTLHLPVPNKMIGVRPTVVVLKCKPGSTPPPSYCTNWTKFASGITLVYQNVNLDGVRIKQGTDDFFKPCFQNDDSLCAATLGIHLTPLNRHRDPYHTHAKYIWGQMLAMYPWIAISGVEFCPDFDPAACDFAPGNCGPVPTHHEHPGKESHRIPGRSLVGPGDDCELLNMLIRGGGGRSKQKP